VNSTQLKSQRLQVGLAHQLAVERVADRFGELFRLAMAIPAASRRLASAACQERLASAKLTVLEERDQARLTSLRIWKEKSTAFRSG